MDKSYGFQFQWPFPKNPNALYRFASKATLIAVLSACKLIFSLKGASFRDVLKRFLNMIIVIEWSCSVVNGLWIF
uniref:BMA-ACL-3, isoform b n=1 Tax=Brugia malayi TaxID=6279 RepID=A0A1I9G0U1_BRUMA|nr:BMA-ACL-3, isoform b [Brugia malayi]